MIDDSVTKQARSYTGHKWSPFLLLYVGRLWSEPRLVGRTGSGVRVMHCASFQKNFFAGFCPMGTLSGRGGWPYPVPQPEICLEGCTTAQACHKTKTPVVNSKACEKGNTCIFSLQPRNCYRQFILVCTRVSYDSLYASHVVDVIIIRGACYGCV